MSLIYEEKTELLRRCFFEVQNEVGLGRQEEAYHQESPLNCLVIENDILLTYTTLFDNNQFAINRGLSYLRALNLEWGIAVDFGKRKAHFTGLHRSTS